MVLTSDDEARTSIMENMPPGFSARKMALATAGGFGMSCMASHAMIQSNGGKPASAAFHTHHYIR